MIDELPEVKPEVKLYLLPGGLVPKRMTEGAIGYDVYCRAIVSPAEMDPEHPHLRKMLFDFKNVPKDPDIARHVVGGSGESGFIYDANFPLAYRMDPHESVLAGIGFTTEMPFPMFYWIVPRSGLSSRWGITVTNAPGTVDPDYRGEAGVLVYNRNDHPFDLRYGMRIAQIIFQYAQIPRFETIGDRGELVETERGAEGFGSTGV